MDSSIMILFAFVIVAGALLFAMITFSKRGHKLDVEKYRTRWLTIEQSLERDNQASYHMAVLNADKLVDQALKDLGYSGQTMAERLKATRGKLTKREAVWKAHKLRNRVAHEPEVNVKYDQARMALASFKRALKDLGAI